MYYNNGKRYFNDISIFSVETKSKNEMLIGDKIEKGQVVGAISLKPNMDCEIEFIFAYNDGKTLQLPKQLKANGVYSFEDIKEIRDVIFKGNPNTLIEIAIGV
ncbi:MAG: hypothetical protein ACRCX8_08575 [Sarcina sp.]